MLKQSSVLCKVTGILAIVGALNWGLVGVFNVNLVDMLFGSMTTISRIVYGLIGVSGLIMLVNFFKPCDK